MFVRSGENFKISVASSAIEKHWHSNVNQFSLVFFQRNETYSVINVDLLN